MAAAPGGIVDPVRVCHDVFGPVDEVHREGAEWFRDDGFADGVD